MVSVRVLDVAQTNAGGPYCVVLSDASARVLPIFIGPAEAFAIAAALQRMDNLGRPLTHQLMVHLIEGLHARVESVTIEKVWLATYFAKVLLRCASAPLEVDCRASDAIALALNAACPIQVSEEVMENSEHYPQETESSSRIVADASAILSSLHRQAGTGLRPPGSEAEMNEQLEVRRALVRHINGLVTRRGGKWGTPG